MNLPFLLSLVVFNSSVYFVQSLTKPLNTLFEFIMTDDALNFYYVFIYIMVVKHI